MKINRFVQNYSVKESNKKRENLKTSNSKNKKEYPFVFKDICHSFLLLKLEVQNTKRKIFESFQSVFLHFFFPIFQNKENC